MFNFHVYSNDLSKIKIIIYVKDTVNNLRKVKENYIDKLCNLSNLEESNFMILYSETKAKVKKTDVIKAVDDYIVKTMSFSNEEMIVISTDGDFYKRLTKKVKIGHEIGCPVSSYLEQLENCKIFYVPSYRQAIYDETVQDKVNLALDNISNYLSNNYKSIGEDILHNANYVEADLVKVKETLDSLLECNELVLDIETTGLKHHKESIAMIGFATSKHDAIAIPVRLVDSFYLLDNDDNYYVEVKKLLKEFLLKYKGKLIVHNAMFDLYMLTYQLFMNNLVDYEGMNLGIDTLTRNCVDTKILAYVCLNSTSRTELSLKSLAFPYLGSYAIDIKNILKHEYLDVAKYCMYDCIGTFYLYEKYSNLLEKEEAVEINNFIHSNLAALIECQLVGIPVDAKRAVEVDIILRKELAEKIDKCKNLKGFCEFEEVTEQECNINSNNQLRNLLFNYYRLPIVDKTATGAPSTSAQAIEKLLELKEVCGEAREFLTLYSDIRKITDLLSKVMKHLVNAVEAEDGWNYLYGKFNVAKALSGRLSSSDPNLQNLPSKGKLGKLIKSCFKAKPSQININLDNLDRTKLKEDELVIFSEIIELRNDNNIIIEDKLDDFKCKFIKLSRDTQEYLNSNKIIELELGDIFVGIDYESLEDKIIAMLSNDFNRVKEYVGLRQYKITLNDNTTHTVNELEHIIIDNEKVLVRDYMKRLEDAR